MFYYLSDLLENIVNIVDVHHLENCRWKVPCVMFLTHSIPITFFLRPCERLFWLRFRALGWWNVLGICFPFGWSRTAVPERANRSDENHCLPPSLYVIAVLPVIVGQNQVGGFEWQFQILTEFKAKLAIGVFVIVDASFLRPNSQS